jgi:glycosyltransferase involved in cell wall biosynthesis
VNVLIWHVHAAWTTAFVSGRHRYLVPIVPDRGPDGRGRARTYPWPDAAVEVTPAELATEPVDVVVLQRPDDETVARKWLGGRIPGRDVAAVWVEHNAPQGRIAEMRHPAADRDDLVLVHVTPTNALFWDGGTTPTRVIEHGVPDPGHRWTGELERAAVVINEAGRRGRVTGTDLLPALSRALPTDLFGIGSEQAAAELREQGADVTAGGDLAHEELTAELARRRVYLHPIRWTSLGLSLLEAMHLGMPVVALATTEVPEAVPADAGVVSNRLPVLADALRRFGRDHEEAARAGKAGRVVALERYGLERFLADWDALLAEVVA